ncbi:Androgen-induced gene 1 protein [Microtus ochrogaster]|uniref:Androgen-induced gene 1 protein n=1 Tax=Microtus ochrogaster TaxID=79684 RepID=A0A8J6GW30_MICOH|nr:Androgen-induced gene 1 protein [Microtus ochrogaster]
MKSPLPLEQVIQAVFFGICVLTDLSTLLTRDSGNQEQERQLRKLISLRDWTLAVLAFPVGVFVVAVFWTIYAYDREMIYPKMLDNFIPGWLNHGMAKAWPLAFSPTILSVTVDPSHKSPQNCSKY